MGYTTVGRLSQQDLIKNQGKGGGGKQLTVVHIFILAWVAMGVVVVGYFYFLFPFLLGGFVVQLLCVM